MARRGENIYKRKDGRYEGRYVTGKTVKGKTKFGYVYGHSYTDVRLQLMQKKLETSFQREKSSKDHLTVQAWFTYWMQTYITGSVKLSSYQSYQTILKTHIFPQLGHLSLPDIDRTLICNFIESLHRKKLSPSTIHGIIRLLHAGIKGAISEGKLTQDPCYRLKLPYYKTKEQRVLSLSEQQKSRHYNGKDALIVWLGLLHLFLA